MRNQNFKMANMAAVVDGMVKEYLLFRGFTATLKNFDNEIKTDKDKSFRVSYFLKLKIIIFVV